MWNRTAIDSFKASSYQKVNMVTALLKQIDALQIKDSTIYPPGLFPSQRYHTLLPYRREDSNIFFTALIVFTLQNLDIRLTESQRSIAKKICKKAIKTYPLYQSRRGMLTYNFWQNTENKQFPHGYLLNKLKFLELPDDVDDSAIIYLTKPHSQNDAIWLKEELSKHANLSKTQIRNTLPGYKDLKAYTTWFGKNMYLEFDFCVLCNALYFVHQYKLSYSEHDHATINYLKNVIISGDHLVHPFKIAPSYPRPALIFYHLSRLMAAFEIPELDDLRSQILLQMSQQLHSEKHIIEKILLAISIGRLTGDYPEVIYFLPLQHKNYYFFNGGLLTAFENSITRKLAPHDIFHLKHTCEAYYLTILVEYEVLRKYGD